MTDRAGDGAPAPPPRASRDLAAGAIFIGIALAFGIAAARYPLGTALRMGPGFFPLVLSGLLGLIGAAIVAGGFRGRTEAAADAAPGPVPWRGLLLLTFAVVFFGLAVRPLGLVPALAVTAVAAALSSRSNGLLAALLMSVGLTLFCMLIFSFGLGVPVPLFGPWLRF